MAALMENPWALITAHQLFVLISVRVTNEANIIVILSHLVIKENKAKNNINLNLTVSLKVATCAYQAIFVTNKKARRVYFGYV